MSVWSRLRSCVGLATRRAAIDLAHETAGHGNPDHAHEHPTWKQYRWVALILTVITALEVWAYYMPRLVASPFFASQ